ncbi:MAG: hypothetical protein IPG79_20185 [Saprospiraceae bacterium]|nr:hypothetical protein [Saprospiraceae bacterium]
MGEKLFPSEEYFLDKQFPLNTFPVQAYLDALKKAHLFKNLSSNRTSGDWITEGPGNIGARINTIAVHPQNSAIMLVGFSEGGIFKTTNGGSSWYPVLTIKSNFVLVILLLILKIQMLFTQVQGIRIFPVFHLSAMAFLSQ